MASGEQTVWFITGASRGVGLEMTRQLLQSPTNTVVAACRTPSKASALKDLRTEAKGLLHVVQIDIDSPESIRACADETTQVLGNKGIDCIINNAGIVIRDDSAFDGDVDTLLRTFKTNVAGAAYVAHAFLPLLEKGVKKTIVNISSTAGSKGVDWSSVGTDWSSIHTSYAISKTALNMLTYKQAKARPDITTISMCPGWLATDMGGPNAMPVSVGAEGILKVIASLTPEKSGQFFNSKGERVPW